ncbi:MAG: hypothetical protein AABW85_02170 [archaeon]
MTREEDDYGEEMPRKKKKGSSRGGFWNLQRIAFAAVFVAGLLIGAYIMNQFVEPSLGSTANAQDLQKINTQLDSLNDKYYACMQAFQIDPTACTKKQ